MDIFVLASVAILAVMAGFWAGRSVQWQMAEGVAEFGREEVMPAGESRGTGDNSKRVFLGQVIGSPVSGAMTGATENGRRMVRIMPEQGKIYAPASGRITRLYPMGSAMQLRTEFGAELLIRAGSRVDEMHSGMYRCLVMEHEVVRKGSLLLEYDVEGLRTEGAGAEVTMFVENEDADRVSVAGDMRVKAGEGVMWIRNSRDYERG